MFSCKVVERCMQGITLIINGQRLLCKRVPREQVAHRCCLDIINFIRDTNLEINNGVIKSQAQGPLEDRTFVRQLQRVRVGAILAQENEINFSILRRRVRVGLLAHIEFKLRKRADNCDLQALAAILTALHSILCQLYQRLQKSNLLDMQKQSMLWNEVANSGQELNRSLKSNGLQVDEQVLTNWEHHQQQPFEQEEAKPRHEAAPAHHSNTHIRMTNSRKWTASLSKTSSQDILSPSEIPDSPGKKSVSEWKSKQVVATARKPAKKSQLKRVSCRYLQIKGKVRKRSPRKASPERRVLRLKEINVGEFEGRERKNSDQRAARIFSRSVAE